MKFEAGQTVKIRAITKDGAYFFARVVGYRADGMIDVIPTVDPYHLIKNINSGKSIAVSENRCSHSTTDETFIDSLYGS